MQHGIQSCFIRMAVLTIGLDSRVDRQFFPLRLFNCNLDNCVSGIFRRRARGMDNGLGLYRP